MHLLFLGHEKDHNKRRYERRDFFYFITMIFLYFFLLTGEHESVKSLITKYIYQSKSHTQQFNNLRTLSTSTISRVLAESLLFVRLI